MKDQGKKPSGAGAGPAGQDGPGAAEARFRALVETSSDWVWEVDAQGVYTYASPRVRDMLGYAPEEVVGKTPFDFMPPDERERVAGRFRQLAANREPLVAVENRNLRKDGREIVLETSGMPVFDAAGAFQGYRGIDRDITERKRAEAALKENEAKYRRLYNETPVLLHSIDRHGIIVDVNDYWLTTLGYERQEVLGRKVTDFYTAASKQYAEKVIHPMFFRDGVVTDIAYQFVKKSGEIVDVVLSATSERDAGGEVVRSQAVITDVTERNRADERTRRYSRDLQRLLSVTREMTATTDLARLYRVSVQTAADLLQFDYSTVMILSEDRARLTIMDSLGFPRSMTGQFFLVEGQGLSTYVVRTKRPEAVVDFRTEGRFEVPPVVREQGIRSALCVPMMIEDAVFGVLIGHTLKPREFSPDEVALYQSIANQAAIAVKNAMNLQALGRSERMLQTIIEHAAAGILVADAGTMTFRFANSAMCRMLGYDAAELLTLDMAAIHPDAELPLIRKAIADRQAIQTHCRRKDGSLFPVDITAAELTLDGRPCLAGFFTDITEKRLLEEERLRSQKLESIGTLAGGIAHDFNNLLQGVFGYISMAKLTYDQKAKSLAMLSQAEQALHQSVHLTSQLLTFAKGGKPVKKRLDLRPVIENAVKFALSGSRVAYELAIGKDLAAAEADEGQVAQVLHNMVLNADQAMPLGGTITISARNAPAGEGFVEISITDRGVGIPPEHLSRIFDPYFTTKEKGSGLGLATAYSIIKNHGGTITVASELGKGSTFTVRLPAAGAPVEDTAAPVPRAAGRRGRILVMDDEQVVRDVSGELLRALGHETAFAEHGEAAIAAYRQAAAAGRPFDLVILDLTVRGGMGGVETVRRLRELDPGVKAVVSSGYSDDAAMANYRDLGFVTSLNKPYTVAGLVDVLRRVLG